MQITRKRRTLDILKGFFLLCHPGPVLLHILAVSLLALFAAWPIPLYPLLWPVLALVIAAHSAMQLSIAVLNDYCDRHRDALSKKPKPIVQGLVHPREALIAGLLLILVMVLLLLPLNPLALLVSLLYLALGLGYDLGLKATPLSGIVFALAIPLIPIYAFVGMGHIVPFIFWQFPVAGLLGVALNLANALPDIEEDAASHARTLTVTLGRRGSYIACSLFVLTADCLIAAMTLSGLVPARTRLLIPLLFLAGLAAIALLLVFGMQKQLRTHKLYFYLVVLTCFVIVGGWLVSIE